MDLIPDLQLWGGIECTKLRVGTSTRDQVRETGHHRRMADLDAIAGLGIRTLRYPVLWETVSPHRPDESDWVWTDERLHRLRALGIAPIAGLVHHGSGPHYTDLLDPGFAEGLARHAEQVAARYPWIDMFTPVNEPLTTARFSGLYGHWHPHGRDYRSFLRALVNECLGVVLSMRAIRKITPGAKLVQTEDLGKTFSTRQLRYQADHENERRWLSFDLLFGRVDRTHPWHPILLASGISERELGVFLEEDGSPDIVGINHYLTSERYLDQRLDRYRKEFQGGNGKDRYADVEAIRMRMAPGETGPEARFREAWERYGRPIAVTESHHGCTRDEQTRWLMDIWNAAEKVRAGGADMRAVTVWSLFGAVDWNSLLTRRSGSYEPGAFDIRCEPPRPTALARAAANLARHGKFEHPVLDSVGWWRRGDRFYGQARSARPRKRGRPILIVGASGALGQTLEQICQVRGLEAVLTSRHDFDPANRAQVEASIRKHKPWAVVNAAECSPEQHNPPERCWRHNVTAAEKLAEACAAAGLPLATFSSDQVFDGHARRPYRESDPVSPEGPFGESMAEMERLVARSHPGALIVRTGPLLSVADDRGFLLAALRDLAAGIPVSASDTAMVSPAYLPDLSHAVFDLLIDGESGLWHLPNSGAESVFELAKRAAKAVGLDTALLGRHSGGPTRAMASERGAILPPLATTVERWARDSEPLWRKRQARQHIGSHIFP